MRTHEAEISKEVHRRASVDRRAARPQHPYGWEMMTGFDFFSDGCRPIKGQMDKLWTSYWGLSLGPFPPTLVLFFFAQGTSIFGPTRGWT